MNNASEWYNYKPYDYVPKKFKHLHSQPVQSIGMSAADFEEYRNAHFPKAAVKVLDLGYVGPQTQFYGAKRTVTFGITKSGKIIGKPRKT